MIIANPIYDTVFKYLLEDLDIARDLLSLILDKEITYITFKPQETTSEKVLAGQPIKVYRLDFKAIVRDKNGNFEKVLIELQKAKEVTDIMRFRAYLGENYLREDDFVDQYGRHIKGALHITTIYFLGFPLEKVHVPVLKMDGCCLDVVKKEYLSERPNEPFITLLNHESYTIQIRLLEKTVQTRLEKVLQVFNQDYLAEDNHKLDFTASTEDPLLQRMVNRLTRAAASDEVRKEMNLEDEMERIYSKELKGKDLKILEQEKIIEEKDKAIEQKDKAIEQKDLFLKKAIQQFFSAGSTPAEIAATLAMPEDIVRRLLADS